jgi:hypothetical protein
MSANGMVSVRMCSTHADKRRSLLTDVQYAYATLNIVTVWQNGSFTGLCSEDSGFEYRLDEGYSARIFVITLTSSRRKLAIGHHRLSPFIMLLGGLINDDEVNLTVLVIPNCQRTKQIFINQVANHWKLQCQIKASRIHLYPKKHNETSTTMKENRWSWKGQCPEI